MKEITYISLFSGIGGFELGLENSKHNFKCLGYSEIDKYAKSIYTRHFPNHKDFGDAKEIKTEDLPKFDFLVGGFPCQAFSNAGKRRGFDDTRGTLFFEIARILKDKRPKYFLLENVKGLLHHDKGKTFQTILEILSDLGYFVKWEVLNSEDFGVPQRRERVFIKGYSRRECGGKVLSFRNCYEKSISTLKCINPHKHQEQKVYDINGLATCSSENGGGQRGKTELYKVPVSDEVIEKNFTKITDNQWATTSKEGSSFAITTRNRESPLHKKQDNYVLEENVREIKKVGTTNGHQSGNVYDSDGLAPTLTCCDWKSPVKIIEDNVEEVIGSTQKHAARTDGTYSPTLTEAMGKGGGHIPMLKIRETTKKGYKEAYPDDGVLLDRAGRKIAKGLVHKGATGTLKTQPAWGTVTQDYRIRKLTPKECERLQAFPDDWTRFGVNGEEISNTQRYKCCGNAVTTSVITAIVNDMFDEIYEEK